MNTSFERAKDGTVEWYTPPEIIHCLGEFDLDPATSKEAIGINNSALDYYTKEDNGLERGWYGRVWLNPPYDKKSIEAFMRKMADHNNGIALVFGRCDSTWFHNYVFHKAAAILFLKKRIKFYRPNGDQTGSPGCGSVLIAYGEGGGNIQALENSGLEGKIVYL